MTELEERIIAFTAEKLGVKPDRVHLPSRLFHDFGMDGDDAVEFFEQFGKDFKVDLAALGGRWDQHFGPEGAPSLGCMVVIVAAVALGTLLHGVFQLIPVWLWTIVLAPGFGWIYTRFFFDRERAGVVPVTVSDLVEAAQEGRWVKQYDESVAMFRTFQ